ncbi:phage tail protein [Streptomyces sp. SID9944]|nr:phage tail protein [Streptomyces sp. SID9944]
MGNDIEIKVKVSNDSGTGFTSLNTSLQKLKDKADAASLSLTDLRTAASGNIDLSIDLDDQATAGITTLQGAIADLKATGRTDIEVTLDDKTDAGFTAITAAMANLRAESPVRLDVTVDGQTADITAAATAMRSLKDDAGDANTSLTTLTATATAASAALASLKDNAQEAARALRTLRGRAAATAAAMADLRTSTTSASNGLRTFNTRADTSNNRLGDLSDRTRTLRSDTDDLDGSMRRLTGTLGGLRGNTVRVSASANDGSSALGGLAHAALMLAPALIPIAASAAPIITTVGAAGAAVGAFGLAVIGQIGAMKGATDAQGKYEAAVAKYGPASKQAAEAQRAYLGTVESMDPATRRAAAALSVLQDKYGDWSKSLAGDTMPVVTKGLAAFGAILPRLTPMVKGASTQLDRMMTILGGGVASGALDKLMDSFAKFSTGALQKANDGLVHFMRTMSEGGGGSSEFREFMDYARKAGPEVGDTLVHLAEALTHVVVAASDTGMSMLGFVNAITHLVSAVPTGVLSTFLQFAMALKLVKLAASGLGALGGLSSVATSIGAMRTAAAGATGPLASLSAAFGALSRAGKVALIGTGIGLLVIALTRLSEVGKSAPPDVDRMTTALGKLGDTGKVSGEALKAFGADLGGLADSLRTLSRPSNLDKTQQFLTHLIGMDSTPVKEAKENLDSVDKALANMVKGGKADLAKAALNDVAKAMEKQGLSSKELKSQLDDYKSALADQALEARLTAESQGLFGQAALDTQQKLDAQKASADGLRESIVALNEVNRAGLGGMIGFEAAIDAAATAAKKNHGALSMNNGVLNLNSEKARNAASALQDLADKTDAAATSQRDAGASWETVNGIYDRGREKFIAAARAMGLSKTEAQALASELMQVPTDVKTRVTMEDEDATTSLNSFNAAVKATPGAKSVTLKTLSSTAEKVLEGFGYKVTHLKNGKVSVSASAGQALSRIGDVARAIASLHDRTITLTANYRITGSGAAQVAYSKAGGHQFAGNATGGLVRRASGGPAVQHFPAGGPISGPGTPTSDSIVATFGSGAAARVSNTEYVVQATAVRKYGVGLLDALNAGRLKLAGFAKGGLTQAQKDARGELSGSFGSSYFGRLAGYTRTSFEHNLGAPSDLNGLVSSLNSVASQIRAAFSGKAESSLIKRLNSTGKALIGYEKQLTRVTASLASAKSKLDDLKQASSQLASSVKSGILGSANITRGASGDTPVTTKSIMAGLTQSRDKATSFAKALAALKAKGLSAELIQQIAEAGIEGGGLETAGALLGASSSEIKAMNSTQAQIDKAAGAAGKTTADAVYAKQIKAQEELVKKLTASQASLQKSMDKLASAMEKALKAALGKKAAGGVVGAAASGGVRGGLTWVGEHEPELLELPVGSRVRSGPDSRRIAAAPWESMLTTRRSRSHQAQAPVPAPDHRPIVLNVQFGTREFGQIWVDVGRKEVQTRGGLRATLGGRD